MKLPLLLALAVVGFVGCKPEDPEWGRLARGRVMVAHHAEHDSVPMYPQNAVGFSVPVGVRVEIIEDAEGIEKYDRMVRCRVIEGSRLDSVGRIARRLLRPAP